MKFDRNVRKTWPKYFCEFKRKIMVGPKSSSVFFNFKLPYNRPHEHSQIGPNYCNYHFSYPSLKYDKHCHGRRPRQAQTCLFYQLACRRRCPTWLTARTPQHANLGIARANLEIAHAWRDVRTPRRTSIYTKHVLIHHLLKTVEVTDVYLRREPS